MATFAQIKEVRFSINDPEGFVGFLEVANAAALPTTPAHQIAYKTTDTENYYSTEKTTTPLTVPDDYDILNLRVSDSRISAWIDSGSVDYAICQGLKQIWKQIGRELLLVKTEAGAESTEYIKLSELSKYYAALIKDCDNTIESENLNNSGRWKGSNQPEIAGGNL